VESGSLRRPCTVVSSHHIHQDNRNTCISHPIRIDHIAHVAHDDNDDHDDPDRTVPGYNSYNKV
jgi:hypothetical protein